MALEQRGVTFPRNVVLHLVHKHASQYQHLFCFGSWDGVLLACNLTGPRSVAYKLQYHFHYIAKKFPFKRGWWPHFNCLIIHEFVMKKWVLGGGGWVAVEVVRVCIILSTIFGSCHWKSATQCLYIIVPQFNFLLPIQHVQPFSCFIFPLDLHFHSLL